MVVTVVGVKGFPRLVRRDFIMKRLVCLVMCLLIAVTAVTVFHVTAADADIDNCVRVLVKYGTSFTRFSVPVDSTFTVKYYLNVNDCTEGITNEGESSQGYLSNIDANVTYDSEFLQTQDSNKQVAKAFPILSASGLISNFTEPGIIYFNASTLGWSFCFDSDECVLASLTFKTLKAGTNGVNPDAVIDLDVKTSCALSTSLDRLVDESVAVEGYNVTPSYDVVKDVTFAVGDADHNNKVAVSDAVKLQRHLASGYDVKIDQYLANVDYSIKEGAKNSLTVKDPTLIRRYLAGGYNVVFS